jgi:hypothetical protein
MPAVITALPGSNPVTRPDCEMAAMPALFVVHTTLRPLMELPCASYGVATRSVLAATNRFTLSGVMRTVVTLAGSATTVTFAIADFPSAVAAMSTRPGATPLTTPLSETVAMAGSALAQTTRRFRSTFPAASFTCAPSAPIAPVATCSDVGITSTASTGVGSSVSVTLQALPMSAV